MRFSTSALLSIATIAALAIRCYVPLSPIRFFIAAPLVGTILTVGIRAKMPLIVAVVGGYFFVVLPVACYWAYQWFNYAFVYDHNQARPFFEDGTIAEGIVYPIIAIAIYGTLAAMMCLAAAHFTQFARMRLTRYAGHNGT